MGCGCCKSQDAEKNGPAKFHEKYKLGHKLGTGTFSQVRLVHRMPNGEPLAVKIIDIRVPSGRTGPDGQFIVEPQVRRAAAREFQIWQRIGEHKHTVRLASVFNEEVVWYFVMEKCDHTLQDAFENNATFSLHTLAGYIREMFCGLEHLHTRSVVHRDIKPANFLCDGDDFTVKLCDFGLAEVLPGSRGLDGIAGTAPFMSPEMLLCRPYFEKTDVWSMGVLIYLILYGVFPYLPTTRSSTAMKTAIKDGQPGPTFSPVSRVQDVPAHPKAVEEFAKSLLARHPDQRWSAADARNSQYLLSTKAAASKCDPSYNTLLVSLIKEAKRAGAFGRGSRKASDDFGLDCLLDKLQKEHQGNSVLEIDKDTTQNTATPTNAKKKSGKMLNTWDTLAGSSASGISCSSGQPGSAID